MNLFLINVKFCNSKICVSTSKWDSNICKDNLNITTVVLLQIYCYYEFMIKMGPLKSKNQVKKSQFRVESPHLLKRGMGR